jgi:hypothetical protein
MFHVSISVSLRVPNTMFNITNGSNVFTLPGVSNISINQDFILQGVLHRHLWLKSTTHFPCRIF